MGSYYRRRRRGEVRLWLLGGVVFAGYVGWLRFDAWWQVHRVAALHALAWVGSLALAVVLLALAGTLRLVAWRRAKDRAASGQVVIPTPWPRDGKRLERETADLYERQGLPAQVMGGAGDLGADVVATTPIGPAVTQCKDYKSRNVGSAEMQQFLGTVWGVHGAAVAVYVTTARFTPAAIELAHQFGVLLVDGGLLAQVRAGQRQLLPPELLAPAPTILEGTA